MFAVVAAWPDVPVSVLVVCATAAVPPIRIAIAKAAALIVLLPWTGTAAPAPMRPRSNRRYKANRRRARLLRLPPSGSAADRQPVAQPGRSDGEDGGIAATYFRAAD